VENSNDFDGLERVNGQVMIDTTMRLGLQGGWSYFRERLASGGHDTMQLGDVALTFCFVQSERLLLRTGLGYRWLADGDSTGGLNVLLSGDYFPVKPVIISAAIDGGKFGDASVIHLRGTAGIILARWELFTGYDWLRIGSVDLHGPVVGLRLWF